MICSFYCKPITRQYKDTDFAEWVNDWRFTVDGKDYWIPRGYYNDGASIPRPFWSLIGSPSDRKFDAASGAHDMGYFTHCLPKDIIDEVFRRFLIASGAGSIRARIMWAAVHTFGVFSWKQDAKSAAELGAVMEMIAVRPDRDKFEQSFEENG